MDSFRGAVCEPLHAAARIISMKNSTMGRMRWKVGLFRMEEEKKNFSRMTQGDWCGRGAHNAILRKVANPSGLRLVSRCF